jgi:hypothetical protein
VRSRTVDPSGSKGVVRKKAEDRGEASGSGAAGPASSTDDRESGVEADGRDDRSAGADSPSQTQDDAPATAAVSQAEALRPGDAGAGGRSAGPWQQQAAGVFGPQQEPAFRATGAGPEHARASDSVQSIPTAAAKAVSRSQERSRRSRADMGFPGCEPTRPL